LTFTPGSFYANASATFSGSLYLGTTTPGDASNGHVSALGGGTGFALTSGSFQVQLIMTANASVHSATFYQTQAIGSIAIASLGASFTASYNEAYINASNITLISGGNAVYNARTWSGLDPNIIKTHIPYGSVSIGINAVGGYATGKLVINHTLNSPWLEGTDTLNIIHTMAGGVTKLNLTTTGQLNLTTSSTYGLLISGGRSGFGTVTPTAIVHLAAGSTAANTAPLKFTSGSLNTIAEVGAVEFLTDKWYATITTGVARKEFTLNDAALTIGRIPYTTTNGRLTSSGNLLFNGTDFTATVPGVIDLVGTTQAAIYTTDVIGLSGVLGYSDGATLLAQFKIENNDGVVYRTGFAIDPGGIDLGSAYYPSAGNWFFDSKSGSAGLQYAADYSANYTLRSLVDKEYVDGLVGGVVGAHVIENSGTPLTARANLNFTNGLTASDSTPDTLVKLGGTLINDTVINGSFNFTVDLVDSGIYLSGTDGIETFLVQLEPNGSIGFEASDVLSFSGGGGNSFASIATNIAYQTNNLISFLGTNITDTPQVSIKSLNSSTSAYTEMVATVPNIIFTAVGPSGIGSPESFIDIYQDELTLYSSGLIKLTSLTELSAGTIAAGTAPLKWQSGPLNTTAEVGAMEFLTDKVYFTITTGAARKEFTLNDAALTSGQIPYTTTNGRLTSSTAITYNGTEFGVNIPGVFGSTQFTLGADFTVDSEVIFLNSTFNGDSITLDNEILINSPTSVTINGDNVGYVVLGDFNTNKYLQFLPEDGLDGTDIRLNAGSNDASKEAIIWAYANNTLGTLITIQSSDSTDSTLALATFDGLTGQIIMSTQGGLSEGIISFGVQGVSGGGGTRVIELTSGGALNYGGNYSASYTDRSLTDRGYVLGAKTFTGKQTFIASVIGASSMNLPHGTAPSAPVNGDVWTTTGSIYARISGVTYDLVTGGSAYTAGSGLTLAALAFKLGGAMTENAAFNGHFNWTIGNTTPLDNFTVVADDISFTTIVGNSSFALSSTGVVSLNSDTNIAINLNGLYTISNGVSEYFRITALSIKFTFIGFE